MPELPEVETIVNELKPLVEGKTFRSVTIFSDRCIDRPKKAFRAALENKTISRLWRRGKYLCFSLKSGSHLTIHLRMTGKLLHQAGKKDKKYLYPSPFTLLNQSN